MRHQDLTINHRLESFVYANKTDRENATGFVAGDIGRIAYQTDTGQYWRLLSVTPTWSLISGAGILSYALLQTQQASPIGVTNAVGGRMMGLGVVSGNEAKIIPAVSGKLRIAVNGDMAHSVVATGAQGIFLSGVFGTGTPPANGVVQPGGSTGFGYQVRFTGPREAALTVPFSISAAASGFVVGTQYWFDLLLSTSVPTGTATVTFVTMTIVELP